MDSGNAKGDRKRRWREVESRPRPMRRIDGKFKFPDEWKDWWHQDFFRKGKKEESRYFRPSKPKEKK